MTDFLTSPTSEYIRNNVLWRVVLNDGLTIYQNDNINQPSSWLLLKRYLDKNRDKYIQYFHLMFRDHYEHVGSNLKFFFFTQKALGHFGTGFNQEFYVAGCGDDINKIHCTHFIVPDLIIAEQDIRIGTSKLCNRGIISHPDYIHLFEKYHDE